MRLRVWASGAILLLDIGTGGWSQETHIKLDQSQPVLVELFTSEGCSSCPPADRLLAELDRRQDVQGASVVVLSEHVDYWNHLGWRDPYSMHKWSERQDAYAQHFHLDSVYTPQAVVDGFRQVTGSDAGGLRKTIVEAAREKKADLSIARTSWDGSSLDAWITFAAVPDAVLYAAIADEFDKSSVARGENAGRQLEHVSVARVLLPLTEVRAAATDELFRIPFPTELSKQHLRMIVFMQDKNSGRILALASRAL